MCYDTEVIIKTIKIKSLLLHLNLLNPNTSRQKSWSIPKLTNNIKDVNIWIDIIPELSYKTSMLARNQSTSTVQPLFYRRTYGYNSIQNDDETLIKY